MKTNALDYDATPSRPFDMNAHSLKGLHRRKTIFRLQKTAHLRGAFGQ